MPPTCSSRWCCWPWRSAGGARPIASLWLWLLVAVVPIALALSHPALFVAGGVSLGLAPQVWRRWRSSSLGSLPPVPTGGGRDRFSDSTPSPPGSRSSSH